MLLQISERENDLLLDVLRSALGNLREEIYKTEAAEYQAQLKQRKVMLTGLLERVAAAEASGLAVGEPIRAANPRATSDRRAGIPRETPRVCP